MDLATLSDFNLVAGHGGFGRAARASGRPKATLARRVAELEKSLGYRLFERGPRTLRLTDEGRALHERTSPLLAEIGEIATEIGDRAARPRGRLRISAPLLVAHAIMGRLAAEFTLLYPDVLVEVSAEDRNVDLVEEGYDLVIRINPGPEEGLIGRCLMRDRFVLVAAPILPKPPEGKDVPAVLLATADVSQPWRLLGPTGTTTLTPRPVLKLSSLKMMRDAVLTGVGAAMLPLSMVAHDVKHGELLLWGYAEGGDAELWALYTSRRLLSRKVSVFLDYLRKSFSKGAVEEFARVVDHA
ncbi:MULTISPECIES: LysR family transcriptional regulator [Rhizobium/Agrobacterium group]|uniref:LysR family transcriptional regulator n=1 Tax=Rhizobium/Agrobacterium group TaxID=227290 RepID=UPI001ADC22B7|nr:MULTISPECIES: LysR family transcriptional regulator [Rhizobium/Agrobacterium group]MBO9112527.1 LysR family transcriptional regulator [Agrobacterium sp. S2/73]QXZ76033.1 LysR family transcriptional regulator [Agrobacterium sp. S7/73]QYA16956.1 LysR family transcriptional regulator [Rhizobium sp. AB2/73]UEQ85471.1 LysR family transcriptional regulator [Rhizobium sp. AB2/73]